MEPPQTEEFVTWNKHSIYNCVELYMYPKQPGSSFQTCL